LTKFLNQEFDPLTLSSVSCETLSASLRMGGKSLLDASMDQLETRVSNPREDQLLNSVMAIADAQLCPIPCPTSHLFRVISLLWRSLICGDGEPDLVWSNPSASTPLRVHAFATILHLVGATSLYLSKNGYTQVDGSNKFTFVYLGRVLALLFDEYKLFGQLALEKFDIPHWCSEVVQVDRNRNHGASTLPAKKSPPKGRHVRHTFELPVGYGHLRTLPCPGVSSFTSTAGDLAMLPSESPIDVSSEKRSTSSVEPKMDDIVRVKSEFKVDSKNDFQTLMRLSAVGDDDHEVNLKSPEKSMQDVSVERPSKASIQVYGGGSGGGGRRYLTMPAPLSTILESSDDMPSLSERNESRRNTHADMFNHGDKDITASTALSKQMRRPKVVKGVDTEISLQLQNTKKSLATEQIITSDDILASMGDAYLDKLSALEGLSTSSTFVFQRFVVKQFLSRCPHIFCISVYIVLMMIKLEETSDKGRIGDKKQKVHRASTGLTMAK
jgi:hypothetical protein